MIFKSNVPMAHRVAFFLAGLNTLSPLHRLPRGGTLTRSIFFPLPSFGCSWFTSGVNERA